MKFKLPCGDQWSHHYIFRLILFTLFIVKRDGQLIFEIRTKNSARYLKPQKTNNSPEPYSLKVATTRK